MSRETRSNSDKEKIDRLYKIATEDKQIKLKIQSSISNLLSSTSTKGTPTTSQQINYSSEHPTIQSDSTDTTLSFESPNSTFVNSEYSIKKNLVKLNLVKFDINNEQIDKYESDSRELTKMALTDSFDSLGYAVEAVPYFDGNNIPLSYFIEGCEEAKSMLPKEAELLFTRIIRTRIIGETRRTIQDHEFDTILQLTKYLKPIYIWDHKKYLPAPRRIRLYLSEKRRGCNNLCQSSKNIRKTDSRSLPTDSKRDIPNQNIKASLEEDMCNCFIRGFREV